MKKIRLYGMILAVSVTISGCGGFSLFSQNPPAPTPILIPPSTPRPAPKLYQYDPYILNEGIKQQVPLNRELYEVVLSAVETAAPASIFDVPVSAEELEKAAFVLSTKFEFSYLKNIHLSQDGLVVSYEYNQEKDIALANKEQYRTKAETLLTNLVGLEFNEFETVLSLYRYFTQNVQISDEGGGGYDAIVANHSSPQGLVYAFQALLDQCGMENHVAAAMGASHIWNVVKVGGKYYHFDLVAENKANKGQRLQYFGMNDDERRNNVSFQEWKMGYESLGFYEPMECSSAKCASFRNVGLGYGIDFDTKLMYFADKSMDGIIQQYSYINEVGQSLFDKRSASLVYHKGIIYFADVDSRNQLYKMNVQTGDCELLDSIFVTRMLIKDNQLIYFDDVSSTEKSLPLQNG